MPITFSGAILCDCCHRQLPFRESFLYAYLKVAMTGDAQMVVLCWGCDGQRPFVNRFGVAPIIRQS